MEFTKYDIREGSTLESIAKENGVSIKELIDFHNSKVPLTQQIHSDYIPLHIKAIMLKPELQKSGQLTRQIEVDFSKIILGFKKLAQYKVEISTSLLFLGKPISENKIESIWAVDYDQTSNTVEIEVLGKKNIKIDGQIKPLLEVVEKINKTTEFLHLQLNPDKTVKDVLNMKQVLEKWENIKFDELKSLELEDDYFKIIIKAYDEEFSNLSKSLQMNILYQIFFYPQGAIKIPMHKSTLLAENKKTMSQLFPQQHIHYDLNYRSKVLEDEIQVACTASPAKNWKSDLLQGEYKKNYAQLIPDHFHFDYVLEGKYIYDSQGVLRQCKNYIKEQANDKLFYIGEYNITLLEE